MHRMLQLLGDDRAGTALLHAGPGAGVIPTWQLLLCSYGLQGCWVAGWNAPHVGLQAGSCACGQGHTLRTPNPWITLCELNTPRPCSMPGQAAQNGLTANTWHVSWQAQP
jgi:hypothetical protein